MPFSSPARQHPHTATWAGEPHGEDAGRLTRRRQPWRSGGAALRSGACLRPRVAGPWPRRTARARTRHVPWLESSAGLQFSCKQPQAPFHKRSRAHLVQTRHIPSRDQRRFTSGGESVCR